jgi:predicted glutamine amidotransferase
MCQLFAINSNAPSAVTFSFTGFSARGGQTGEHADGWGMAFHGKGGCRVFLDDTPASRSPLAAFLREHPIRATSVLAHIRKATQGAVQLSNCHPFQRQWRGRQWAFCHNGDLKFFEPWLDARHQPIGSTDSEAAFCWLLQQLDARFAAGEPDWPLLAPALAELVGQISPNTLATAPRGRHRLQAVGEVAVSVAPLTRRSTEKRSVFPVVRRARHRSPCPVRPAVPAATTGARSARAAAQGRRNR